MPHNHASVGASGVACLLLGAHVKRDMQGWANRNKKKLLAGRPAGGATAAVAGHRAVVKWSEHAGTEEVRVLQFDDSVYAGVFAGVFVVYTDRVV